MRVSARSVAVCAVLLAAAGAAGWRFLGPTHEAAAQAPGNVQQGPGQRQAQRGVPVVTEPATIGPMPLVIPATGNAEPEAVVTVRSRVDGQVEKVHVEEGQRVRRGQPLFTLDSRLNQALLAQQEAVLARDRAQALRARSDAERYTRLRGEGFAAQQRLEQAQADADAADATMRAQEAQVAQTRLQISFATIVAEADGRLGSLPIQAGNLVRGGDTQALATITQVDPILVSFSVPERWLPEIREAMQEGRPPKVTARAPGDDEAPVEGELVFIDSQVDTTTGTVALKARFRNPEERLWPGQYQLVTLVPRVEPKVLSVPVAAVQTGQAGRHVFVVEDGVARRRPVELVRVAEGRAVIKGEVAEGARVVVDGAQLIADGTRVIDRATPARVANADAVAGR
jgi:multidrug efflux system membrane fusion protein